MYRLFNYCVDGEAIHIAANKYFATKLLSPNILSVPENYYRLFNTSIIINIFEELLTFCR